MTIGELISHFPADSAVQINIADPANSLVFIPDPGFYQRNPKIVADVDRLPVKSIRIELDELEDQPIILLIINDTQQRTSPSALD